MARPKTVILRMVIDRVQRAHNCQHNHKHRMVKGDKRLKILYSGRSPEHYCLECGVKFLKGGIQDLEKLKNKLSS